MLSTMKTSESNIVKINGEVKRSEETAMFPQ